MSHRIKAAAAVVRAVVVDQDINGSLQIITYVYMKQFMLKTHHKRNKFDSQIIHIDVGACLHWAPISREKPAQRTVEGYIVHDKCYIYFITQQ